MSEALFGLGGLRFLNEDELELRDAFQARVISVVKRTLLEVNPAWKFYRTEGPCLIPRSRINSAYEGRDVFVTNHEAGNETLCLRPETTQSSYAYAGYVLNNISNKLPICVYQAGKSFRRELNDGATAEKMRFNEFTQLEFQCIYSAKTGVDYRKALVPRVEAEIARFTKRVTRVVPSDRIPDYATSTEDIEACVQVAISRSENSWREMASCSIRNDFNENTLVCEIAIGLDRVARQTSVCSLSS